jgi:hydroxyacylglutathione hydrolase
MADAALNVFPVPAFKDNYIWLITRGAITRGSVAVVVDPGDATPVEAVLRERGLELGAILLTHHHADHVGGVAALLASRSNAIDVYGPRAENIAGVSIPLDDGAGVTLDSIGLAFDVIAVPGHTRGHIAYYGAGEPPLLFCGDTMFAAGCGRLFEGTAAQMHASLSRLAALPGETRVYCAHEYTQANLRFARTVEPDSPALIERERSVAATRAKQQPSLPSTITLERATNPFLRGDERVVRDAAERHSPGAGASSLSAFTALRRWKDSF